MDYQALERFLKVTIADKKVSASERKDLKRICRTFMFDDQKLSFVKNRAFDIAHAAIIAGDSPGKILGWLRDILKIVDSVIFESLPQTCEVYFSPGEECIQKVINLIKAAEKSIDICVFTITDDRIKRAIFEQFRRDCKIRIITDAQKMHDPGSDVRDFAIAEIPTRIDFSRSHMHHKFAIFDDRLIVNGSFNWTRSAADRNQENIIVSDDARIYSRFMDQFEFLWRVLPPFQLPK